jgi:hypothetical protein
MGVGVEDTRQLCFLFIFAESPVFDINGKQCGFWWRAAFIS